MVIFNANDIFKIAVRIEENGERAYRLFAKKFNDEHLSEVFITLADEEVNHREYFSSLAEKTSHLQHEVAESFNGEYMDYFRDYVEGKVFTSGTLVSALDSITIPIEAIEFGIARELDSILYYQEIRSLVPERQRAMVDTIIAEERRHFVKLQNMRREHIQNAQEE